MKKIFTGSISIFTVLGILLGSNFVAPSSANAVGCVGSGSVTGYYSYTGNASYSSQEDVSGMVFTMPTTFGVQSFNLGNLWINNLDSDCDVSLDTITIVFSGEDFQGSDYLPANITGIKFFKYNPDGSTSPLKNVSGPFEFTHDTDTGSFEITAVIDKSVLIGHEVINDHIHVGMKATINNPADTQCYNLQATVTPEYSFPDMVSGEIAITQEYYLGAPMFLCNN